MGLRDDIEKVQNKLKEVEGKSFAMELLDDLKKTNKRMFIIILITLSLWFVTGCYLVYILNDIGTIETTQEVTQENEDGNNNFIGNDGVIDNGEAKN